MCKSIQDAGIHSLLGFSTSMQTTQHGFVSLTLTQPVPLQRGLTVKLRKDSSEAKYEDRIVARRLEIKSYIES